MPEGEARPLVLGNRVYTLSAFYQKSGKWLDDVVALDANSGAVRWRSPVGGNVIGLGTDGTAIYLSAELYLPSGELQSPGWEVEALRTNDGQTLWKTPLTYKPSAPIVGDYKVVITATGALTVSSPVDLALALSAADGSALWRIPSTLAFSGRNPTTDGALVYMETPPPSAQASSATPVPVNSVGALIRAIRLTDGQQRWETPLRGTLLHPLTPVVTNGKVYVTFTGYRPDLAVLDAASGRLLWRFGAPSSEIFSLALPA
jgi:outer membrane protein assembly factor BamB